MSEPTHHPTPQYPPLPEKITSFGATIAGNQLFVYGGHTGTAHAYSTAEQSDQLQRLNLDQPAAWETVARGPKLQGLALVSYEQTLYRIGGFTAKNAEGEDDDLWSQSDTAAFDVDQSEWSELPALPEPRSSFDAAVLGSTVFVAGGWRLAGKADSVWPTSAWKMNLADNEPTWQAIADTPFQRRALAVAAHAGKIFVIGGMQLQGAPSKQTDIYDPATDQWTVGPELVGEEGMTGFGASAFACGGSLFVSTINGDLQQLSADETEWKIVRQLPTARFFHQMVALDDSRLLMIGGANMRSGKFDAIEVIEIA